MQQTRVEPRTFSVKLILLAALIGICSGVLGALCGIGGGIVMVPAFVGLLGLSHKQAVATSMAVIIVTAIAATLNNANAEGEKLIDWKIAAATGIVAAIAAWYGTDLMHKLSTHTLTRIFGVVMIAFGVRILWKG